MLKLILIEGKNERPVWVSPHFVVEDIGERTLVTTASQALKVKGAAADIARDLARFYQPNAPGLTAESAREIGAEVGRGLVGVLRAPSIPTAEPEAQPTATPAAAVADTVPGGEE